MVKDFRYCKRLNLQKDEHIRHLTSEMERAKRESEDRLTQLESSKDQLARIMDHNSQLLRENEYLVRLMREHGRKEISTERYRQSSSTKKSETRSYSRQVISREHMVSKSARFASKVANPPSIGSIKASDD